MSERYVIKDRWIFDTKLNKNIHSIDCYEEKSVLDIMNSQDQRIAELEEQIDYSFKINTWLIKKYGKEFWQDIGTNENDDTITNLIKLDEVFDKIYEEMKKEMPKKWYEYGFGSKK